MSLLRTIAPTRTPPPGSSSIPVSGTALRSTRAVGRSTCSFIRSTSVVPPARYRAPAAAAASRAARRSVAVTYRKASITSAAIAAHRLDRGDDARIRAAAADVAAHTLAHIVVVGPARFAQKCDRRHDLT